MNERAGNAQSRVYDRTLLLHGPRRNEMLSLAEIEQYGLDSFADADYVSIYGMPPREWYRHGIRLPGRTAVECTRDALGDLRYAAASSADPVRARAACRSRVHALLMFHLGINLSHAQS